MFENMHLVNIILPFFFFEQETREMVFSPKVYCSVAWCSKPPLCCAPLFLGRADLKRKPLSDIIAESLRQDNVDLISENCLLPIKYGRSVTGWQSASLHDYHVKNLQMVNQHV